MGRANDWQVFILALVVIVGGGYALLFAPSTAADVRVAVGGFIGAVITYFFGRQVAQNAATSTVRALTDGAPPAPADGAAPLAPTP